MSTTATENKTITPPAQPPAQPSRLLVQDQTAFANLLDTGKYEHMWRVAQMYAGTELVPDHFKGKPNDCFIMLQMAIRLGVDPFMMMQNTYVVYGRPGMEAKLAIALINSSGLFTDSLDYEIEGGDDPRDEKYRVRAWAIRKSTNKIVHGPRIDWDLVKSEKWDQKKDRAGNHIPSKWNTMPAQMFCYRAATFFGRLHCPERLMGMQMADELEDIGPGTKVVENTAALPSNEDTAREAVRRASGRTAESKAPEPASGSSDTAGPAQDAPGRQEETKPEVIDPKVEERRQRIINQANDAKPDEKKPRVPTCSPNKDGCVPAGAMARIGKKDYWICNTHAKDFGLS